MAVLFFGKGGVIYQIKFNGQTISIPPLAQAVIRELTNNPDDTQFACEKFAAICAQHYLDPQKIIDAMDRSWKLVD